MQRAVVVSYQGRGAQIDYDTSKSIGYNLSLGLQAMNLGNGPTKLLKLREYFCFKVEQRLLTEILEEQSFEEVEGKVFEIVKQTLKIIPLESGEIVSVVSDNSLEYEISRVEKKEESANETSE